MRNMRATRKWAPRAFLLLAFATLDARAQLAPGPVGYCFPPGGKAGTTVEVRLGGVDWTPDVEFIVHDPRVKVEALSKPSEVLMHEPPYWFGIKSYANDPPLPREVTARFIIPSEMPPGPLHWTAVNANGGGGGGVFIVGDGKGAELTEDEFREGVQDLPPPPVTVNGRLRRIEEVDRYRFVAAENGLMTCDLMARRVGSDFLGVIEIEDEAGNKLAESFDTEGHDPTLTFAVKKGVAYTVLIREIDHGGYRSFTYRLLLTSGPTVVATIPLEMRRGESREVEFIGVGIATGEAKLESIKKQLTPPNTSGRTFSYALETGSSSPMNVELTTGDIPEMLESEVARPLLPPVAVTGRFSRRGERDAYSFAGKKGEYWDFAIQGSRNGSPIDAGISVLGPDGKPVATKEELGGGHVARVSLTLAVDGEFRVVVGDISGKAPRADSVYQLVASRPAPGFQLRSAGIMNVPIGGKAAMNVAVSREGGYQGPIAFSFRGLPEGVTVPKDLMIPQNVETFVINLDCAKEAAATAALVDIVGTADIGGHPVSRQLQGDFRGDLTPRGSVDNLLPHVLVATTLKPPFKARAAEADGGRRIPRGATHLSEVVITRTDGFNGEIILDMAGNQQRHRQGIRGPRLAVAPDQKSVNYPVFAPEWLETTRTSRIGLVAMARIPDPKGTVRDVLAPMEGQITLSIEGALMKLSHSGDELVTKPGRPLDIKMKLSRSPKFQENVTLELIVPDRCKGLVWAKPVPWPRDQAILSWRIESRDDKQLLGVQRFKAVATSLRDQHPVVSETELEVEFISGSRLAGSH